MIIFLSPNMTTLYTWELFVECLMQLCLQSIGILNFQKLAKESLCLVGGDVAEVLVEELGGYLREESIGEDVFLRWVHIALLLQLGLELCHGLSLCIVSTHIGDDVFLGNVHGVDEEVLVDCFRGLAELATGKVLDLVGNHLVALAQHDIEGSLSTDNLAGGSDERRIAKVCTDAGHLVEKLLILVFHALFLQLVDHVAEHAARNLEVEDIGVNIEVAFEAEFLNEVTLHLQEVLGDGVESLTVKTGVIGSADERLNHGLGAGLAGIAGERSQSAVDDIYASLDCLHVGHGAKAGGVVGMELNRNLDGLLQLLNEVFGNIRLQQTGHILDADGVNAHLLKLLCQLNEGFVGMEGADGVYEAALNMGLLFALEGFINGGLEIVDIVEGIEDTEYFDTVLGSLADESADDIVIIVIVAEKILAAEEHLDRGVLQVRAENVEALPGIFVQEAEAAVKCSTAPCFKGIIADSIKGIELRNHLLNAHAGSTQGLVSVTQDCFGNLYGFFGCHYYTSLCNFAAKNGGR